jgi:hypothetical protein
MTDQYSLNSAVQASKALKRRVRTADAALVRAWTWKWSLAGAMVLAGAVVLGPLVHPHVGSGRACEGIGFGCTPERDTDTLLIVIAYSVPALLTVLVAWRRYRRGRSWRAPLAAGVVITLLATGAAVWSQLPRYPSAPGPLNAAGTHWERVLADGRAVASPGTPLGNALRGLKRRGPIGCRDAYGRSTGTREFRWSNRGATNAYAGTSDSSGALTAAALGRWAERLRGRGLGVDVSDPTGEPTSDRRLQVRGAGAAAGGALSVRASFYISELEITMATGCHRS